MCEIYVLTEDDVKVLAKERGLDPDKFTSSQWHTIYKAISNGMGASWEIVVNAAIDLAVDHND